MPRQSRQLAYYGVPYYRVGTSRSGGTPYLGMVDDIIRHLTVFQHADAYRQARRRAYALGFRLGPNNRILSVPSRAHCRRRIRAARTIQRAARRFIQRQRNRAIARAPNRNAVYRTFMRARWLHR